MESEANQGIKMKYQSLQVMSQDEEAREMYEARQEYLLEKAMTLGSVKRGGKEEGRKETREEIAKKMISHGMDDELIISITGISLDKISELRRSD